MRLLLVVCIAVALCLWTPAALADTVQMGYSGSSYGLYQTNRGGEFTLTPSLVPPSLVWPAITIPGRSKYWADW